MIARTSRRRVAGPARGARARTVLAAWLVLATLVLTGSAVVRPPLRALQLNLCASGRAACYTGLSVAEAVTALRTLAPDVVTVNEVCDGDVAVLAQALERVHRGSVVSAFMAAGDRPSGGVTRCRDGRAYGIGVLAHHPARRYATDRGRYPMQDLRDPEQRVWLCVHPLSRFVACTTHLASTDPAVALAQCRHLMHTAVPALRARHGYRPTVVAGDLNLRHGAAPDVRGCLPSGHVRRDDGGVQHLVATSDVTVSSALRVDMRGTTDHQALLVTFAVL